MAAHDDPLARPRMALGVETAGGEGQFRRKILPFLTKVEPDLADQRCLTVSTQKSEKNRDV
jgi:hypothetical protein